jgi:hypothetical protein
MDRGIVPSHTGKTRSRNGKKKQKLDISVLKEDDAVSNEIYPFVQLILEFTNNCLISGVAHVVYPRLLYS